MASIEPYKVSVSNDELERLAQKLSTTTLPDELDESGWGYGTPLAEVKKLLTFWKDTFRWKDAEAKINQLPQYKTAIRVTNFDELSVHFVHQQSRVKTAIPLLFCHGCELVLRILGFSDTTSRAR